MDSLLSVLDRFDPAYPASAALVFLLIMAPVWVFMSWDDMSNLRIRNGLVLFVLGVFVVLGPLLMPINLYLGQLLQITIVFAAIIVLYAAGTMGGGDAKFMAAASPFFLREDWVLVLMLFIACALAAFVVHRAFLWFGADRQTPLWLSWRSGKRFPLGFALGGVVTIYLAAAAF
ncbi:prepilin peptidase [Shimia ponticola]|uniref:prepilin peptidase n=1 Tax=Shimia ponticola TaxID=2582893 RepID=UPI0011BD8725|nr:prepilin peptidase [Shimia ponticola]